MVYMFYNCYEFNQPLVLWDVSNIKNICGILLL